MSVTRDKRNGTWYVQAWYKTYDGKRAHKVKRGFKTKPEALAWERDFYAVQAGDMDMRLVDFLELYKKDMGPRLRLNTWKTKESIITKRILPYLGEKRMNQIAPVDIVRWQNELMALEKPGGGGFSATYLKTVNNQLCALFNHAVRFYGLSSNPCRRAESMGSKSAGEMRFWTKGQYLRFSDEIMDKPLSFHAFETLYWCGVREGELLALKPRRFDFERGTLTVAESYRRIDGQDVLTDPKTPKSKHVIATRPREERHHRLPRHARAGQAHRPHGAHVGHDQAGLPLQAGPRGGGRRQARRARLQDAPGRDGARVPRAQAHTVRRRGRRGARLDGRLPRAGVLRHARRGGALGRRASGRPHLRDVAEVVRITRASAH